MEQQSTALQILTLTWLTRIKPFHDKHHCRHAEMQNSNSSVPRQGWTFLLLINNSHHRATILKMFTNQIIMTDRFFLASQEQMTENFLLCKEYQVNVWPEKTKLAKLQFLC